MNGGRRLLAGVAAVVLVFSALGLAAPTNAGVSDQPVRPEIAVNR